MKWKNSFDMSLVNYNIKPYMFNMFKTYKKQSQVLIM